MIVEAREITAEAVWRSLAACRFDLTSEARTQDGIAAQLVAAFGEAAVSREHRLAPCDRPDFLIGGRIVVEVKGPRHQATAVRRQLVRYAAYDEVEGLVLATARAMHLPGQLPKPGGQWVRLWTVNLGRAWL